MTKIPLITKFQIKEINKFVVRDPQYCNWFAVVNYFFFSSFFKFIRLFLYFLGKSIDIFVFLGGPKGVPYKLLKG